MSKRKGIKEGRLLRLEEIRIFPDTLSRQSLIKLMKAKKTKEIKNGLAELMASMKVVGQIECIGVRQIDVSEELLKEDGLDGVYQLIYGLRRFLAAQFLGWEKIKAVVLY